MPQYELIFISFVCSTVKPVAVSKHSLTRARDYLYVFGGNEQYGKFSHSMYKILCGGKESDEVDNNNSARLQQWKLVKPRGGNVGLNCY